LRKATATTILADAEVAADRNPERSPIGAMRFSKISSSILVGTEASDGG